MPDLAHQGQLILKLYELRTDPALREARAWFVKEFQPESATAIAEMMVSGFGPSAKFRMVTTYWEMAAALVNHGAIDRGLFLAANTEHVAIFAKLHPHLNELRSLFKESDYLQELEQLVLSIPDILPRLDKRRRIFQRWAAAEPSAQP
jgi:hypothetical protein